MNDLSVGNPRNRNLRNAKRQNANPSLNSFPYHLEAKGEPILKYLSCHTKCIRVPRSHWEIRQDLSNHLAEGLGVTDLK